MNNDNEIKRDKLKLTKEEAKCLIWGDGPEHLEIVQDNIVSTSRWTIEHEIIIKDTLTNKFYKDYYSIGATESCPERPYDYSDPKYTEVFPKEKIITIYE